METCGACDQEIGGRGKYAQTERGLYCRGGAEKRRRAWWQEFVVDEIEQVGGGEKKGEESNEFHPEPNATGSRTLARGTGGKTARKGHVSGSTE